MEALSENRRRRGAFADRSFQFKPRFTAIVQYLMLRRSPPKLVRLSFAIPDVEPHIARDHALCDRNPPFCYPFLTILDRDHETKDDSSCLY
jgi:hypothetical protein